MYLIVGTRCLAGFISRSLLIKILLYRAKAKFLRRVPWEDSERRSKGSLGERVCPQGPQTIPGSQ
jgi:hypothetical protein